MLDFTMEREADRVCEEGVTVTEYHLLYPIFEGGRARRAWESTLSDLRALIAAYAAEGARAYAEDPDPHRRFRFAPYRVDLRCTVTLADEGYLSFFFLLTVRRGGRQLLCLPFGDTYRRADGARLPLSYFLSRRARRGAGWEYCLNGDRTVRLLEPPAAPVKKKKEKMKTFGAFPLQKAKKTV